MGKWTRRAFLTAGVLAGGGLLVGVGLRPGNRGRKLAPLVSADGEHMITAWLKIDPNNHVTAILPHSEMGQGVHTALTQMLADELDAGWEDVSFMEAPAQDEYANYAMLKGYLSGEGETPGFLVPTVDGLYMQITKTLHWQLTGGSGSVRWTGVSGMRVAGAAARALLIEAAAESWQVPVSEVTAENTHLIHVQSSRRAKFSEFAEMAAGMDPSRTPQLKDQKAFKIMGRSMPRRDIPAKVDGSVQFAIDTDLPGMKYAAIEGAPVFGAQVASVDDTKIRSIPGVHQVVALDDAVAVVADSYWLAEQMLSKLMVKWTETPHDAVDSTTIRAQFDHDLTTARNDGTAQVDRVVGDAEQAFLAANRIVTAEYQVPFLAHACMEPMNATARFDGAKCEIWVGSQDPLGFKYQVAEALGVSADMVTIHQHPMGGGFGRRVAGDVAIQAARIARAVQVPVKLIWSREQDIRHDLYRPAVTSRFRAAISASNEILGWENTFHQKFDPIEAPYIPYSIGVQDIRYADSPTHVPTGSWRSVDHSQHGFFVESFIDEVAGAIGKDPYILRRDLLAHQPRHRSVLDIAAQKAAWGQALPPGRGRGISFQESFGTLVAQVVEVTVKGHGVSVDRVVCAVDPGFAVNPDGLSAQMESGIIFGLSAALVGEITITDGAVVQGNFHDYPVVRMADAPAIEVHIINSGEKWGGAGEPATPGIAPALANAVYSATGIRVRQLPLSRNGFALAGSTQDLAQGQSYA